MTCRCPSCEYLTRSSDTLRHHMENEHPDEHGEKRLLYDIVDAKIDVKEEDGGERTFRCLRCAYTSSTRANFRYHVVRSHTRSIRCPECDYVTKNAARLVLHRNKNHSGEGGNVEGSDANVVQDDEELDVDMR